MNHNSTLFLRGKTKTTRAILRTGALWALYASQRSEEWNDPSDPSLQLGMRTRIERLLNLISITSESDVGISAGPVLSLVGRAEATDQRDKIYSILGLLDPSISAGVTPDYSLPVQQIYTKFMKSAINGSGRLDQIVFGGISAEKGWPSWVPDWRKPLQRDYIYDNPLHGASRDILAQFRFIEKEKDRIYLACSGFHIDTVDGIAAEPPLDSHVTQSGVVSDRYRGQELEAIIEITFLMGHPTISSGRIFKIPWNLSGDTDDSLANIASNLFLRELTQSTYFKRWNKFRRYNADFCIGGQRFQTFFPQSYEPSMDTDAMLRCVRLALPYLDHRALITTRKGYLGLAPETARPGDVVAILFGCCWPVLLRPCDDGLYQVIGECYVHGLMKGEILDQQRDGHVSEQEFVLC